jgi:hypothetical protein
MTMMGFGGDCRNLGEKWPMDESCRRPPILGIRLLGLNGGREEEGICQEESCFSECAGRKVKANEGNSECAETRS